MKKPVWIRNPFKKKKKQLIAPKHKYLFTFSIETKYRALSYSVEADNLNPFDVMAYRRLWVWLHSRKTPLYILKAITPSWLPETITFIREDITRIVTRYDKNIPKEEKA